MAAIQRSDDGKKGVFYLEENGSRIAEMTYVWAGDTRFIIDHTEVFPGNEGRGLGKQLVAAAVAYARETGKHILPLCPFAKGVFQRTPAFADVLT
ncbi:MAG: GNAT family N-acetyltransferase [Bacteroidia bacterium]|nr:GNAT family N-acetyltransferase [Bacteroidia bacterium]